MPGKGWGDWLPKDEYGGMEGALLSRVGVVGSREGLIIA